MAKDKQRFRRRERTVEDVRRKASEGSRDYDNLFTGDIKMFKPKEGENNVRIMPATWGFQPYTDDELEKMSDEELDALQVEEDNFGNGWDLPIYVHYGVGPDNASYLCREKMLGEPCPVCAAKAETRDADEADALSPSKRGLCFLIDRDAEKEGPQVWSMPFSKIRNEVYARSVDKKHGTPILVDDPDEGFDIFFRREGKDQRTSYTGVEIDRDPTPLHDDEHTLERWLAWTMEHRLPDILNFYPTEHIEKVLFGRASAKSEDDDTTERSAGRGGRRGSLRDRRRGSSSTEEERDYRDEEAADEEEVAPRGRRRRGAPAAEEEEERPATRRRTPRPADPDEGDEEEAAPRGRRGRSAPAAEPDEEDEDEGDTDPLPPEDESPSGQARKRLGSLRSRRGRS